MRCSYMKLEAMITTILMFVLVPSSLCQDDYIDFTDMGTYDHGEQINRFEKIDTKSTQIDAEMLEKVMEVEVRHTCVENSSRPMKYLQRVVNSILKQMNVQSHAFGPGEAITIDLQAELKFNDYVMLNKFINEHENPEKFLSKVDETMSNLVHVVKHDAGRLEFFENLLNHPINNPKSWMSSLALMAICFMLYTLSNRALHSVNMVSMLVYGFFIIFLLSCVWTFLDIHQEKIASNHAKKVQASAPPKDCEYHTLSTSETVGYYFRVNIFGYKDPCEQYYQTTMTDPFWSVNPLEALSRTCSVLIFSPLDYIGTKLGQFFGGILKGIPIWLQPFLVLLIFGFAFLSIFHYRIASPLLTIEPARRVCIEQAAPSAPGVQNLSPGSPAITDRIKNEIMQKPEQKVVKSIRDAGTDMDGFDNYLNGFDQEQESTEFVLSNLLQAFLRSTLQMLNYLLRVLDYLFRQSPPRDVPSNSNVEDNSFEFPHRSRNENLEIPRPSPPIQIQEVNIEDILIPRRRMHVGLERSENNDKENIKPRSSKRPEDVQCGNTEPKEMARNEESD